MIGEKQKIYHSYYSAIKENQNWNVLFQLDNESNCMDNEKKSHKFKIL